MPELTDTGLLTFKMTASGAVEDITLPFKVDKLTLKGQFPRKILAAIIFAVIALFTYVWVSSSIIETVFKDTAQGTAGYDWGMGITLLGMFVAGLVIHVLAEKGTDAQKKDRQNRQQKFAEEQFGPWLEVNGEIKNSERVAERLFLGDVRVKEDENTWGAFDLEFSATGFMLQNQTLRIWRWVKA